MLFKQVSILFRPKFLYIKRYLHVNTSELIEETSNSRLLKVAIIGTPNAGKSTFINNLMDRKVCPTSSKVHTTRNKTMAIFTEGDAQIVFLDTPGLVNMKEQKRYKLEKSFLRDSKMCLQAADIIGVIHDTSNVWTRERLDIKVIRLLENHPDKPSFLVLNKIDLLKSKRKLLDITRLLTDNQLNGQPISGNTAKIGAKEAKGWPMFTQIFMVSSLTGDGLSGIKTFLVDKAKFDKWLVPGEVWTDKTAKELIENMVKAKLLDFLPQEIPYQLKPQLEFFDIKTNGEIVAVIIIHSPTKRIAKLVAGSNDGKLYQITDSLKGDLIEMFQNDVRIKLVLESKEE